MAEMASAKSAKEAFARSVRDRWLMAHWRLWCLLYRLDSLFIKPRRLQLNDGVKRVRLTSRPGRRGRTCRNLLFGLQPWSWPFDRASRRCTRLGWCYHSPSWSPDSVAWRCGWCIDLAPVMMSAQQRVKVISHFFVFPRQRVDKSRNLLHGTALAAQGDPQRHRTASVAHLETSLCRWARKLRNALTSPWSGSGNRKKKASPEDFQWRRHVPWRANRMPSSRPCHSVHIPLGLSPRKIHQLNEML